MLKPKMDRKVVLRTFLRAGVGLGLYFVVSFLPFEFAAAADHPILYFFWGDGCPHCAKEDPFLKKLQAKYPELEMRWFEVWKHPDLAGLADAMRQAHGLKTSTVPLTFLGKWNIAGFTTDEETGQEIEAQVIKCLQEECLDALELVGPRSIALKIAGQAAQQKPEGWQLYPAAKPPRRLTPAPAGQTPQTSLPKTPTGSDQAAAAAPATSKQSFPTIRVPLLGRLSVEQTGLPLFTILIGGLDGFNPCAFWVLSFLLTLVIHAKSRAKILIIGGIFVVASGVIYFLFMIAWLNMFKLIPVKKFLTVAVGTVAIVMGLINCKDFFFFKKGLSLTIPESAQPKLFERMRKLVHTSALPAMILGTIVLAATANLIELACTAGFPAIYTQILTLQKISGLRQYLYLIFYNIVYVIPLAVIVGVFAWKMGGRKLSEKEGRILKLVGGTLMLALGLMMLVKPELLMFG